MNRHVVYRLRLLFVLLAAALPVACGGQDSQPAVDPLNVPPTVDAGMDQVAEEGSPVTLTATATDTDGVVVAVSFVQTAGPAVILAGADTRTSTFVAPMAPINDTVTLVFEFTATDNGGAVSTDEVECTITSNDFLLFMADKDADEVFELYKADVESGAVNKVSGTLTAGGDVWSFALSPDGLFVAYTADQDTDDVVELYVAPTDGMGSVKVSGALVTDGDVKGLAWAPDGSRIAYTADQDTDGKLELYAATPDGATNVKLNGTLVAGGDVAASFAWASDGSRIAYVADQDQDDVPELYSTLPNGTGNVKINGGLIAGGGVSSFVWAPDASRIAYLARQQEETVTELHTSRPDGSDKRRISAALTGGGDVFAPFAWSPDASRLAYLADQETNGVLELFSVLPDGSGSAKVNGALVLGGTLVPDIGFEWAPDSAHIAYRAEQDALGVIELYVSRPDGGGNVRVSGDLVPFGNVTGFRWSPDAVHIAYVADQEEAATFELFSSRLDGTENNRISAPPPPKADVAMGCAPAGSSCWSPDGSTVSYLVFGAPPVEAFAAPAGGGGSTRYSGAMTLGGNVQIWPVWSPDGSRIAYVADQDVDGVQELYLATPDGSVNARISGPLVANGETTDLFGAPLFRWSP